jgi:hypothetical protein
MPVNYLLVESLEKFHKYYGDDFTVECPTGSRKYLTIREVANELARRLTRIFLKDDSMRRPVFNGEEKMQTDPHLRDYVLFYEYFMGTTVAESVPHIRPMDRPDRKSPQAESRRAPAVTQRSKKPSPDSRKHTNQQDPLQ